jgi:uncharacterized protein
MSNETQRGVEERVIVDVIEKNMKALVMIKAPMSGKEPPITEQDVYNALRQEKVTFGIRRETIHDIIGGKQWGKKIIAAVGIAAIDSIDATIEFNFPTDTSFKPQVKDNGQIDYKEVSIVHNVEKNAVLARKIPAVPGTDGTDVFGRKVAPVPGKDAAIVPGKGAVKDPSDPLVITSTTEGIVFFNSRTRTIEVQTLHVVKGSVDYSTGNLNVKSSVEIKGDIKPSFSVTTPYSIEVKGVVDHAAVTCEGSLTVKEGIKGEPKRLITVGGDIHAGYIHNQRIRCGGGVYALNEIRNSIIESDDEVVITSDYGIILGGRTTAANKVSAGSIGNLYHVPTEIEAGVYPEFREKFLTKEAEIKALRNTMDGLERDIISAEQAGNPSAKSYKSRREESVLQMEKLKTEINEIEKEYYIAGDAVVMVTRKVYPGVTIKIKNAAFEVPEPLSRVAFRQTPDGIVYAPLF